MKNKEIDPFCDEFEPLEDEELEELEPKKKFKWYHLNIFPYIGMLTLMYCLTEWLSIGNSELVYIMLPMWFILIPFFYLVINIRPLFPDRTKLVKIINLLTSGLLIGTGVFCQYHIRNIKLENEKINVNYTITETSKNYIFEFDSIYSSRFIGKENVVFRFPSGTPIPTISDITLYKSYKIILGDTINSSGPFFYTWTVENDSTKVFLKKM